MRHMISIDGLSYYLGERALFENASLFITPTDRIGLIGLNGMGKSTLLRMMVGDTQPSEGGISKSKDTSIGFLNQDLLSYESDESILHVAMQAFSEALVIQDQIDRVLKEMESDYKDELVDRLTRLQEKFEALEGYVIQSRAEEILEGIGFSTQDLQRPLREFSGGWRMRVMLAKLLLEKPSLLLLDEPTNHLDLPSIQWLEQYLQTYEGAFIIVSHDRTFLNRTVNKVVEVYARQLHVYEGNYDFYEEEKELRNEIQQNAYENQQQKIKQTERFITRFRAKSTKARQVQSKIKMLDKMDKVDAVVDETMQVNFKFNFRTKSGRHVKRLEQVGKAYGTNIIFEETQAHIERGDKIALIGANGKGKSTLLRIIDGSDTFEGKVESGHNVTPSFYAQHQLEALDVNAEIIEELKQQGTGKTEQELRNILGCFLFTDDDVFKKIKVLSGGEKSRVALAKTLISEANFLLLDEPTNHLDMLSVGILVQALEQYEGTFIVVSHDRHFVSQIANKIWWIENNQIKEYPGTYEEYEWWTSRRSGNDTIVKKPEKKKPKQPNKSKPKSKSSNTQKELTELEKKIEALEEKIKELELQMADPANLKDLDLLHSLDKEYSAAKNELSKSETRWEKLVELSEED